MQKKQIALREALEDWTRRLSPGGKLVRTKRLGTDDAEEDEGTAKGVGYGTAVLLEIATPEGGRKQLVFRTSRKNAFGHDRRSDRAAEALLAYDTAASIPSHAGVVDVGAIQDDGSLESLAGSGELYFVTEYLPGTPYAEDLRRIGQGGGLTDLDRERCDSLADYLAKLHAEKLDDPDAYRRAVRDLIGHGEGLFGLADSFREDAPGAPLERIRRIEALAVDWRWRLRGRERRLSRTHGDFHPFNVLFDQGATPLLLDASRGCKGDPADDVVCLAVNYLFFALEHPETADDFKQLWRAFWQSYLTVTRDGEILESAPPYLAWRVLVLANPMWYPHARERTRRTLLDVAEKALENGSFDPVRTEEMFA